MGEIATMMREGYLCCKCGAALEDNYITKKQKDGKYHIVGLKINKPVLCKSCEREIAELKGIKCQLKDAVIV